MRLHQNSRPPAQLKVVPLESAPLALPALPCSGRAEARIKGGRRSARSHPVSPSTQEEFDHGYHHVRLAHGQLQRQRVRARPAQLNLVLARLRHRNL